MKRPPDFSPGDLAVSAVSDLGQTAHTRLLSKAWVRSALYFCYGGRTS